MGKLGRSQQQSEMLRTFGVNLRKLRSKRGLRQKDVYDVTGIRMDSLSNYERGITNPHMRNVVKLAEFYQVKVDKLFKGAAWGD